MHLQWYGRDAMSDPAKRLLHLHVDKLRTKAISAVPAEARTQSQPARACASAQLRYLDSVLEWLAAENVRPGGFAEALLDLRSIGVAGHSRGAKLAALHLVSASVTYPAAESSIAAPVYICTFRTVAGMCHMQSRRVGSLQGRDVESL